MAKKNRVIRYLIPVLAVLILAAWYGVSRYRGVGGLPPAPQPPELAAPVGPDSVSVQLRTDDAAVTCSYYSGYPFEKWSGPSLS